MNPPWAPVGTDVELKAGQSASAPARPRPARAFASPRRDMRVIPGLVVRKSHARSTVPRGPSRQSRVRPRRCRPGIEELELTHDPPGSHPFQTGAVGKARCEEGDHRAAWRPTRADGDLTISDCRCSATESGTGGAGRRRPTSGPPPSQRRGHSQFGEICDKGPARGQEVDSLEDSHFICAFCAVDPRCEQIWHPIRKRGRFFPAEIPFEPRPRPGVGVHPTPSTVSPSSTRSEVNYLAPYIDVAKIGWGLPLPGPARDPARATGSIAVPGIPGLDGRDAARVCRDPWSGPTAPR